MLVFGRRMLYTQTISENKTRSYVYTTPGNKWLPWCEGSIFQQCKIIKDVNQNGHTCTSFSKHAVSKVIDMTQTHKTHAAWWMQQRHKWSHKIGQVSVGHARWIKPWIVYYIRLHSNLLPLCRVQIQSQWNTTSIYPEVQMATEH